MLAFVLGCGRLHFDPVADGNADAALAVCTQVPGCSTSISLVCGNRCYSICADPGDQPTQTARCTAAGMRLATIADATEDACIGIALPTAISSYWIGLEQSSGATQPTQGWHWITGEPFAYASWLDPDASPPPNPDDFDGVEDGFEQCAWKNSTALRLWEDASCDNPGPGVICEP